MVRKSIGPDVEVVLFLDFENYFARSPDELEEDKRVLSEQLREYAACADEIGFVFSFIQRNYIPNEEELADWVLDELGKNGYANEKVLDGIVLGISHAVAEIRSSLLPGRVANFVSESQG